MIENETVRDLLAFACGVHSNQIVDAPAWLSTDHFDIDGVLDIPGQPNIQQMRGIVRKLLIERFNLKIHSGKREMSVYVITLAKGGSKMTKNTSDPNGLPKMNGNTNATERTIRFTNASMADIVLELTFDLDRPVVDQTGLQGRFDSLLKWKRDESLTDDPNAPPGFFTAIQEQLGLKVSPVKAPADVVLVDNVERPSSN
jgi:uncharacterized protein (TIGR03435 family)